jgi:hypothetical protein|tara:strand:+ start:1811 stop:2428 length:618 start_codon:yes stop_codon:yes gene_type:complete
MTIALVDLPIELDMNRWETVNLLSEGGIPYTTRDGELYVEQEDVFGFLYDRLFTHFIPERQLEVTVDYYVGEMEDSPDASRRLCNIINYLSHEDPDQLERLMEYADDEFSELTRPYNPRLAEKGAGISITPRAPFSTGQTRMQENQKTVRIKRRDIKNKARVLVDRVSEYFDIDLPEKITQSKGTGRYASISYGSTSGFTDLEAA